MAQAFAITPPPPFGRSPSPPLRAGEDYSSDSAPVYLRGRTPPGMKWLKNPFVLVFEGFVLGALLIATSTPNLVESRPAPAPQPLDSSVIPNPSR
jgi:hypothetical protein